VRRKLLLVSALVCLVLIPGAHARNPKRIDGWTVEAKPSTTGSIEMPARPAPAPGLQSGPATGAKSKASMDKATKWPAPVMTARTKNTGVEFEPVSFELLPGWAEDDHLAALKAFQSSCQQVIAGRAGRSTAAGSAELVNACTVAMALPAKMTKAAARAFIEANFTPHRVVHSRTEGLLTGYYEPLMDGSRTPTAKFQTPLYRRPADLVSVARGAVKGSLGFARKTATGLEPFATRAEIEAGALDGQNLELLYLASPVEKFFLQIQGAGRIRLTDGTEVRVQYDGKNGHPYTSIGRYLMDKGLLAADKMSMGALGRWLQADRGRGSEVMNQNASYVFFREMPADARGPQGAFEVTLIAGRSLAIDPAVHRLGGLIFVSGPTLRPVGYTRPFGRLMVAHDVGGAIKGPERADIYFGSGDIAESQASGVRHSGNLYAILPVPASLAQGGPSKAPEQR